MNLHLAILDLASRYGLAPAAVEELRELAGIGAEPPSLARRLSVGMALLGAILGGLGIVFWVAANWQSLSPPQRFALLETTVACMLLGAWHRPSARVPLALAGFLACGALLACYGQAYQTGADPWQLFALWAALCLPLCLGVRHDALWTAWTVVALTASVLLADTHISRWWRDADAPLWSSLGSWLPALLLAAAFRFLPDGVTGAGQWPLRLCMVYATAGLAATSILSLFPGDSTGFYLLSLLAIGIMGYGFSQPRLFDIFVISALGLGANIIVASGLTKLFFHDASSLTSALIVVGGAAAGLLALTVKLIVHLARRPASERLP